MQVIREESQEDRGESHLINRNLISLVNLSGERFCGDGNLQMKTSGLLQSMEKSWVQNIQSLNYKWDIVSCGVHICCLLNTLVLSTGNGTLLFFFLYCRIILLYLYIVLNGKVCGPENVLFRSPAERRIIHQQPRCLALKSMLSLEIHCPSFPNLTSHGLLLAVD